jgi:FO synthase
MSRVPPEPLLGALRPALRDAVESALEGRRLTDARPCRSPTRGGEHPGSGRGGDARSGRPPVVTYSRKVFIPLTNLCRDICSYCTFAHTDTDPRAHMMSLTRCSCGRSRPPAGA